MTIFDLKVDKVTTRGRESWGIFSTREKAEAFARKHSLYMSEYSVVERPLDPEERNWTRAMH